MSLVLIIEDEPMLRESVTRGLGKMPGIEVADAASVDDALALVDRRMPDLILSDIDMPGRTGLELLGELGRRGASVPIIYVSAYLKAYGAQIPPHARIDVLEKPVALDEIRALVREKLAQRDGDAAPFAVPDFLQLAAMSRRSVIIEASWPDDLKGQIVVCDGEVWHAEIGEIMGAEAFAHVVWKESARVRCRALTCATRPARTVDGTVEWLLMDSARAYDELRRSEAEPSRVEHAQRLSSPPSEGQARAETSASLLDELGTSLDAAFAFGPEEFDEAVEAGGADGPDEADEAPDPVARAFALHLDDGVAALLVKDYEAALAEFNAANALRAGDTTVQANLRRLAEMGYDGSKSGETR
ncbi:MAG: response regulator [Myxococcales bacterium]|nr:response regulator [Myxococcales bacterium]